MAPAKRQRTTASQTAAQSTLTFNRSKPNTNRVTKQTTPPKSRESPKSLEEPSLNELKPEPISFPPPTHSPPDVKPNTSLDTEDETEDADILKAKSLSQKQIQAYWTAKESARKTPRVHQQSLSLREKILREFDLS
ncbi:MAG: hypothetical protein Q9162_007953, partial [Coniocarpon cinnabarinum]